MKEIKAVMLSVAGEVLTDAEKSILEESNPIGITLFARNIINKEQVSALTRSVREVIGRPNVLIAVDQEGGRVCRFTPPEFRSYYSSFSLSSLPDDTKNCEFINLHAALIASDLRTMGINWNYAPVLDIPIDGSTSSLNGRCFQGSADTVALYGKTMTAAYKANGICPCIKHMPGHGRAKVDPHLHLPVIDTPVAELMKKDFIPFAEVADIAPAGMTAHIVIPEIDACLPVTQSKKAIDNIIRGAIGFDGFLLSDAIDMKALSGSVGEKTASCLAAGCDAVCYCFGKEDELKEVISAASFLTDKGLERLAKIAAVINAPDNAANPTATELAAFAARYAELGQGAVIPANTYDAVETLHKMQK